MQRIPENQANGNVNFAALPAALADKGDRGLRRDSSGHTGIIMLDLPSSKVTKVKGVTRRTLSKTQTTASV
jgi:hypothetical protein